MIMIKSEAKKNYFILIEVFIIREAEKGFQSFLFHQTWLKGYLYIQNAKLTWI